jgi:hypothetical protein
MTESAALLPTLMALLTSSGVTSQAADVNARTLPKLYSFYQDDALCWEHAGEATQVVTWNGRTWHLTAPLLLVSPPSETKRNGTPLDVKQLDTLTTEAVAHGASLSGGEGQRVEEQPLRLRLVVVVHDLAADEPATFYLETIVAVRLCGATEKSSASVLYVGPRKGVKITEWWRSRKSQRWIDGYRNAFELSVADALEWAAGEATTIQSRSLQ